ncbi:hypothetical protein HRbin29_00410 [bacterium HR29]|jgi:hypothetical protein|nr:hypothetical protein HRbin29_00410 [bacterium HR29]
MRRWFLGVVGAAMLGSAACGGGPSSTPLPTAAGTPYTDEQYLAVMCRDLDHLTDVLVTATNADDVRQALQRFIDDLRSVVPPADLAAFHAAFIAYLEEALAQPLDVITRKPPLPEEEVRRRLAAKEPTVPECRRPTFFSVEPAATPTP